MSAASAAEIDLVVLNNQFSPRVALENAERFVAEKVDLVIDSQINVNVASQIAAKFLDAGIPLLRSISPTLARFTLARITTRLGASLDAIWPDGLLRPGAARLSS